MASYLKSALYGILVGVVLFFTRAYFKEATCLLTNRLDNKIILITGANTGIGYELSKEVYTRGAIVHMACRDMKKCGEAKSRILSETNPDKPGTIQTHQLDLADLKSISNFVQAYRQNNANIHILVNNAGVMMTPYSTTRDGFELQMGTNHLGHFYLTNLLLETIENTPDSRILILSSMAHYFAKLNMTIGLNTPRDGYDPSIAYCNSKMANVLHGKILAKKLQHRRIPVVSIHPGAIATDLQRTWPNWVNQFYKFAQVLFVKTPKEGIQTQLCCCLDEDLMEYTGQYFADVGPKQSYNQDIHNETLAEWLWQQSEKLIQEKLTTN